MMQWLQCKLILWGNIMIFKIIGGALIAWAVVDFGSSYMGTDVWSDWLGIQLPEVIYRYSAMIVGVIGGVIWKLGDAASAEEGAEQG
jgi:hypothetical protein